MGWNEWIRTVEIAPSLTAADPSAVDGQVEALLRTGCRIFHIDNDLELLASIAPLIHRYDGVVDVHLARGARVSDAVAAGADSVTLDVASQSDVDEARSRGSQVGVSFGEEPGWLRPDVDLVSVVVDDAPQAVNRVREIAKLLPAGMRLQVEGEFGYDTVRAFYDAGATVIVVGESIFEREDLPRAYRRLVQALA